MQNVACGLSGSLLFFNCKAEDSEFDEPGKKKVSFGICTDVHQDFFPNVEERLGQFIKASRDKEVDFIIQLGDFCYPKPENMDFRTTWDSFNGSRYHVLGNHDMEKCSKEEVLDFWGVDKTKYYYSFDVKDFHFIVLDPNNIYNNGEYTPYNNGNYSSAENINYLTPEQLNWLREDLAKTSKKTVIFSHQPFQIFGNINEVLGVIDETNGSSKIITCFSGHNHSNWYTQEYGLNHVQINSMCFKYVGDKYIHETSFPDEVEVQYPLLKKMIAYKDALYCFVELDLENKEIRISGKKTVFIPPGPEELGYSKTGIAGFSTSIDSRIVKF